MAYSNLPEVTVGSAIRAVTWGNLVRSNLIDHESRIADLEDAVDDLETGSGSSSTTVSTGTMLVATVSLTNAQIKALPTTAITIVDAPAINARIKVHNVSYYTFFTSGAYTNVDTTASRIVLQTSAGALVGGWVANDSTVLLTKLTTVMGASALVVDCGPYQTNDGGGSPVVTNTAASVDAKAIQLAATNNGAGDFTGGHASNTLTVLVYYSIETLGTTAAPFVFIPPVITARRAVPRRQAFDGGIPFTLR